MPFPFFAHQAAVLPLKLRWPGLSGTGLVLGSLAPDLGYFLIGAAVTRDWHRPKGILLYCLPVALLLYLLLTRALAAPVARHLPRLGRFRLHELAYLEAQPRTIGHLVVVAACVIVGAVTHLGWDLFTHDGTWMGGHIAWLADAGFRLRGHPVSGARVLWTVSTILGGLFSVLVLREIGARRLLHRWAETRLPGSTAAIDVEAPPATSHLAFWAPILLVTPTAAVVAWATRPPGFDHDAWATWVLVFLRSSVPGFLVLAISAWRERRRWRHRSGQAGGTSPRAVDPAA